MNSTYYLGAITGTSVDGLDLALVRMDSNGMSRGGEIDIRHSNTVPIPPGLRAELLALGQPGANEIDRLGEADTRLGRFVAASINEFLSRHGIAATSVAAIGSHGQTVRHRPPISQTEPDPAPFTLQIGDANQIAELTGITTVADFRRRDMAAGGEGAPLVPLFHQALLGDSSQARALLNIGGIANLTGIPGQGDANADLLGFDTGPGNGLMDAWIARHQEEPYDADGAWAQSGRLDRALLEQMRSDAYFHRLPPKSTGKEMFNLAWLDRHLADGKIRNPEDVQATLLELTSSTIAQALAALGNRYGQVLVCGGGRLNGQLMLSLGEHLGEQGTQLATTEQLGVDGDSLEAAAFAWLACRTLAQLPGNQPSVTGATGPRVLGAIYPA